MSGVDYKHIKNSPQGKVTKFWFPDGSSCYIVDKGNTNPNTQILLNINPEVIEKCKEAIERGDTNTYDIGFTREEVQILIYMIEKHNKGELE